MEKNLTYPPATFPAGLADSLYLAAAALLWSGNFIVGRLLRDEVTPVTLNTFRWTLALLILLALFGRDLWAARAALRRHWKLVAGAGLTGIAAFHTCVYLALQETLALNALLLLAVTPVAIMLLSRWTGAPAGGGALGVVVSLGGAALLVTRGDAAVLLELQGNRGDLWMLAAIALFAVYSVLLQRRPAAIAPSLLLTASVAAGVLWMAPFYALELARGSGGFAPEASVILGIGYVTLGSSVIAFLLWARGVAALGASRAGQFIHLMPVFGAMLSVVLLGESIAPYHLAGAALVFAGIALARR